MTTQSDPFFVSQEKSQDPFFVDQSAISKSEENAGQYALRTGARLATRVAETPVEVAKSIVDIPEMVMKGPLGKKISAPFKRVSELIPEKEDIRNWERRYTGEYLQPQSESEELLDESTQDFTSLLLGPKGKSDLALSLGKKALMAISGTIARKTAEELGAGSTGQGLSKLGAMTITAITNPGKILKMSSELRNRALSSIPDAAIGNSENLEKSLKSIIEKNSKLAKPTTAQRMVKEEAEALLQKVQSGKMTYKDAVTEKTGINKKSENLYDIKDIGRGERSELREGYDSIRNSLKDYLSTSEKEYPKFWEDLKKSDELYGSFNQSRKYSNWIMNNKGILTKAGIGGALYKLFTLDFLSLAEGAAVGGASAAALKTIEFLTRLKSPAMREYYSNALKAAANESQADFVKNVKNFQKEAKKDPDFMKELEELNTH